jgi:uncharacterized secreted protein with C-terminal beta-propeller domain
MRNTPLRVAIGVVVNYETGEVSFFGGPMDAVKAKTKNYILIVPDDQSGKELFKQVLKKLAEKVPKEMREKIQKASFEEIRDFIPYGKGRILAE